MRVAFSLTRPAVVLSLLSLALSACAVASPDDPEGTGRAAADMMIRNPIYYAIDAPQNVALTKDPALCGKHSPSFWGGFICAGALSNPRTQMLVWNCPVADPCGTVLHPPWDTQVYIGPPQGYRIYVSYANRYTSSGRTPLQLVATQTDPTTTAYGLIEPSPELSPCYVVHSYKGAVESVDSNPVCVDASPQALTLASAPVMQETQFTHFEHSDTGYFTTVGTFGAPPAGQMVAGYQHAFSGNVIGKDDWAWAAIRGAVRFDLRGIGRLWKATLHLHRAAGYSGTIDGACNDNPAGCATAHVSAVTCVDQLLAANADWTSGLSSNTLPEGGLVTGIPGDETVEIDVTSTVRPWVSNLNPNNGFIIRSTKEGWARESAECRTYFDGVRLDVQYF